MVISGAFSMSGPLILGMGTGIGVGAGPAVAFPFLAGASALDAAELAFFAGAAAAVAGAGLGAGVFVFAAGAGAAFLEVVFFTLGEALEAGATGAVLAEVAGFFEGGDDWAGLAADFVTADLAFFAGAALDFSAGADLALTGAFLVGFLAMAVKSETDGKPGAIYSSPRTCRTSSQAGK